MCACHRGQAEAPVWKRAAGGCRQEFTASLKDVLGARRVPGGTRCWAVLVPSNAPGAAGPLLCLIRSPPPPPPFQIIVMVSCTLCLLVNRAPQPPSQLPGLLKHVGSGVGVTVVRMGLNLSGWACLQKKCTRADVPTYRQRGGLLAL